MIWKAFGTHRRAVHRILVGKRKDFRHLADLGADVRIILRLILKE